MTASRAGELLLAADFSGAGTFPALGVLRQPSLALSAAIGDLRLAADDAEMKPVMIHALATKIAGRCAIASAEAQLALADCCEARLAAEWVVTIPALGSLRALFLIARLGTVEQTGLFDLVLQLAGKPSFSQLQTEDAETN